MKQSKIFLASVAVCIAFLQTGVCFAVSSATTMAIGKMQAEVLVDTAMEGDVSVLHRVTPELLDTYLPSGKYPLPVNVTLIKGEKQVVLVDAGVGATLLQQLAERGVAPDDVDIVLLTHSHFDHVEGLVSNGKAVFPRAEVYISKNEADFLASLDQLPETTREEAKKYFGTGQVVLQAYQGRVHTFVPHKVEEVKEDLIPGVQAIAAYGHTPGHTVYLFHEGEERLMLLGDLFHAAAIQFPRPEVTIAFDLDQTAAAQAREEVFAFLQKNAIPFTAAHKTEPQIGVLQKSPKSAEQYVFKAQKN